MIRPAGRGIFLITVAVPLPKRVGVIAAGPVGNKNPRLQPGQIAGFGLGKKEPQQLIGPKPNFMLGKCWYNSSNPPDKYSQ